MADLFDNAFFRKTPQFKTSFTDDAGEERSYLFPTFYAGTRAILGIFTCDYAKAKAWLPARLSPVPAGIGRAVIAVGCFEYLNVKSVDPYNEVLFGVPVLQKRSGCLLPAYGMFVRRLLVDKPENVQRGKHIWGMDKSLAEIKFFDEADNRVCEAWRNDRRAVRFEVPRTGRTRPSSESRYVVTEKDGRILRSYSTGQGKAVTNLRRGRITLSADPFGVELESLGIGSVPLVAKFVPSIDQAVSLPREAD